MSPNHLQSRTSIPSPLSPAYLFSFILCWSFLVLHRHINSMIGFFSCLQAFEHLFFLPKKMSSSSHSTNLALFFFLQNLLIYCWQNSTLCLSSKCLFSHAPFPLCLNPHYCFPCTCCASLRLLIPKEGSLCLHVAISSG